MKRKVYAQLLEWKQTAKGKSALLIEGARRIGKSYIVEEFDDENGQHVCVEYDTNPENGLKHQQTILKNDPNAKVVLKTVE